MPPRGEPALLNPFPPNLVSVIMRFKALKLSLVVAASILGAGPARAQTPWRYKFTPGETLHYAIGYQTASKFESGTGSGRLQYDATWTVTAVDSAGEAKITQKIGRVRFHVQSSRGNTDFDSKDGKPFQASRGSGPLTSFLNTFPGSEITLTVSARGEVKNVSLPKKLADSIKEMRGAPGTDETFCLGGFKRLVSTPVQPLPSGALAKGEEWEHTDEYKSTVGKVRIQTQFKYDGPRERRGKQLDHIAVTPTTTIERDRIAAAFRIKSQKSRGTILFDAGAGRLTELSVTQEFTEELPQAGVVVLVQAEATVSARLLAKPN